ncbi:hypothetical protein DJ71_15130, partial [Halorubrum sp. E3]
GEYLVEEAIDEYAEFLADEIEETVGEEFEGSHHALRVGEFEQVVENAIDSRFDVLSAARSVRPEILRETRSTLVDRLGLAEGPEIVTVEEPFDRLVDERARRILGEVKGKYDVFASPSEFTERAEEQFDELRVARDDRVNEHVREAVIDRYETVVADEEF